MMHRCMLVGYGVGSCRPFDMQYRRVEWPSLNCGTPFVQSIIDPRDWTRLDNLQVLTKWLNVTPKTADAQRFDRGVK